MKKIFILLLTCVLAFAFAACAPQQPAGDQPDDGAITAVEERQVYDLKEMGAGNSTFAVTGITLQGDSAAVQAINESVSRDIDRILKDTADDDAVLYGGDTAGAISHELAYQLVYSDDELISLRADGYDEAEGAAHGMSYTRGYVYNAVSGERIGLGELVGDDYVAKITDYIVTCVRASGEEANYFPDYRSSIAPVLETEDCWYVAEDGIHIFFAPYTLAANAFGVLEFVYAY